MHEGKNDTKWTVKMLRESAAHMTPRATLPGRCERNPPGEVEAMVAGSWSR